MYQVKMTDRKVNINKPPFQIKPDDSLFFIGSCFSDNISKNLNELGITSLSNPFGTIYNPISIIRIITDIIQYNMYEKKDILKFNDNFISLNHSHYFKDTDDSKLLTMINNKIKECRGFILKKGFIFITLGTAVVYEYQNKITANCHRIPNENFTERLLDLDEVVSNLIQLHLIIKKFNPDLKIILTTSPIRHYPERLRLNTISKSILNLAIDEATRKTDSYYFPSYEIVNEQLTGNKYYKKDLIHLNKKAVKHITNVFTETFFSKDMRNYIDNFSKLKKTILHRPQNPQSGESFETLIKSASKLNELKLIRNDNELKNLADIVIFRLIKFFPEKKETKDIIEKLKEKNELPFFKDLTDFINRSNNNTLKIPDNVNCMFKDLIKDKLFDNFKKLI